MSFALVMYLDDTSSRLIEAVWKRQAAMDISTFMLDEGYRPHITLGACESLVLEECRAELESFAAEAEPLTVELSYIGLFSHKKGAVFLGVTVTEELIALHKSFHEGFGRHSRDIHDVFQPGKWVPHCTMAYHESREKDLQAIKINSELIMPLAATCNELAVIEFPPWQEKLVYPMGQRP